MKPKPEKTGEFMRHSFFAPLRALTLWRRFTRAAFLGGAFFLLACTTIRSEPLKTQERETVAEPPSEREAVQGKAPAIAEAEQEAVQGEAPARTEVVAASEPEVSLLEEVQEPATLPETEALGGLGAKALRVTPGAALPPGSLDKAVIQKIIRDANKRIRYCYEKQLLKQPTLEGKVTISFLIGPDGKVISATPQPPGLEPTLDSCVAGVIATLTFPPPSGGGKVTVKYPFHFRPAP